MIRLSQSESLVRWCRIRWLGAGVAVFYGVSLLTFPATAQQPTAPSVDSAARAAIAAMRVPVDSAAVARAAAIADTGRMTPGYRDLSRYDTPGYCLAAVRGVTNATWRRNERAFVVDGSDQDTIPTAAVAIGRRCLAGLPSVGQVTPIELPNLFRLSVLLDDSTLMHAVIDRQLALAKDTEAKGYVLADAIDELLVPPFPLVDHPIRLAAARALAARLDALGPEARAVQLHAHGQVWDIVEGPRFDTTDVIHESAVLRALLATLAPAQMRQHGEAFGKVNLDSVVLLWTRHGPDLGTVVHDLLEREFVTQAVPGVYTKEVAQYKINWMSRLAAQVGQPAPPITGKFVFPKGAANALPAPGRVTLVLFKTKGSGLMDGRTAMLQRLYDKYHARGLDIVLVLKTEGYSWSSPPQAPADEAKTIAWYYYDYLNVPFTIVVDETPFTKLPDGRRVPGRTAFQQTYMPAQALIGRDGRIYTTWIGLRSERQMEVFIEQALAQKVQASM